MISVRCLSVHCWKHHQMDVALFDAHTIFICGHLSYILPDILHQSTMLAVNIYLTMKGACHLRAI